MRDDWAGLILLDPIRRRLGGRGGLVLKAGGLVPDHQATAQHEGEHQRRSGALEGITYHPVLVDAQQHQHQQRDIGRILDLI